MDTPTCDVKTRRWYPPGRTTRVPLKGVYCLLALALQALAVEAVVEAAGGVALRVTLPVVEVAPALQRRRAVLPRSVEVQRAVAAVPAARVVVAHDVAELVAPPLGALRGEMGGFTRHVT